MRPLTKHDSRHAIESERGFPILSDSCQRTHPKLCAIVMKKGEVEVEGNGAECINHTLLLIGTFVLHWVA